MRYVFQETILRGINPLHSGVDLDFRVVPTADGAAVDQSFGHAAQPQWELNCVSVDDTCVVYSFETIAFKKIRMRSTSPYQRLRIDPEVTVLQLHPPLQEEADVLPVGEKYMGLVL